MSSQETNPRLARVRFSLRTTGVNLDKSNPLKSGIHTRGYLPHVKREGASYFVTFRLADSLPIEVAMKLKQEREQALERLQILSASQQNTKTAPLSEHEINREYYRKLERYLDRGAGACHLRKHDIATLVAEAMLHFENERYLLHSWVIMPNHVHAIVWPMPNHELSDILKSWKRFTARKANVILNRTGKSFWQPESFDHWIRNDEEMARIKNYITRNPVKAGLCSSPEQWPWSIASPQWKNSNRPTQNQRPSRSADL